ncbi:MAG: GH32 C-terminal domain-containing protein [Planctomycetota bacterium]|nr:GH32 C-terminal domain-containing protein [Planctomycetota bacterium]
MLIQPAEGERLWDSWMFEHDGLMHLFYQANDGAGRIGHAVSTDLLRWERRADLVPPFWQYTGMVVRDGARFVLGIGEVIRNIQTGRFFESTDLEHWKAIPGSKPLFPQGPHYRSEYDAVRGHVAWRDPYLFKDATDGCWHAVFCAQRPAYGPDDTGAAFGHARTKDFVTWEFLPPLDAPAGKFYHVEVPELVELDGTHYLLFSTGSCYGTRIHSPRRRETVGTYYLKAERREGPFTLPEDPLLIGAGHGRMDAYVGRIVTYKGERFLYHHIRTDPREFDGVWAVPKRLMREANGDLYAGFFEPLRTLGRPAALAADLPGDGSWTRAGEGFQARALATGTSCTIAKQQAGLLLECTVASASAGRCAVVLRAHENMGVMVRLDYDLGEVQIGMDRRHPLYGWGADYSMFVDRSDKRYGGNVTDSCRVPLAHGRPYRLAVYARNRCVEVYLDGRWIFTTMMYDAAPAGDVALSAERGEATFTQVALHAFEALEGSRRPGQIPIAL